MCASNVVFLKKKNTKKIFINLPINPSQPIKIDKKLAINYEKYFKFLFKNHVNLLCELNRKKIGESIFKTIVLNSFVLFNILKDVVTNINLKEIIRIKQDIKDGVITCKYD